VRSIAGETKGIGQVFCYVSVQEIGTARGSYEALDILQHLYITRADGVDQRLAHPRQAQLEIVIAEHQS
jgi:hypothetical protein